MGGSLEMGGILKRQGLSELLDLSEKSIDTPLLDTGSVKNRNVWSALRSMNKRRIHDGSPLKEELSHELFKFTNWQTEKIFPMVWEYLLQFDWAIRKTPSGPVYVSPNYELFKKKVEILIFSRENYPEIYEYAVRVVVTGSVEEPTEESTVPSMKKSQASDESEPKSTMLEMMESFQVDKIYVFASPTMKQPPLYIFDTLEECCEQVGFLPRAARRILTMNEKNIAENTRLTSLTPTLDTKKYYIAWRPTSVEPSSLKRKRSDKSPDVDIDQDSGDTHSSSRAKVEDEPFVMEWKIVYPWLQAVCGWTCDYGNGLINWYYLRPGFSKKNLGIHLQDHFYTKEEVMDYVNNNMELLHSFTKYVNGDYDNDDDSEAELHTATKQLNTSTPEVAEPEPERIFENVSFIMIGVETLVEKVVKQHGGRVVEHQCSLNESFSSSAVPAGVVCISYPGRCHTVMYQSLVALGCRILDVRFVLQCVNEDRVVDWESFELPSGINYLSPNRYCYLPRDANTSSVFPFPRTKRVFSGLRVHVIPSGDASYTIMKLIENAGGKVFREVHSYDNIDFVLCDPDNAGAVNLTSGVVFDLDCVQRLGILSFAFAFSCLSSGKSPTEFLNKDRLHILARCKLGELQVNMTTAKEIQGNILANIPDGAGGITLSGCTTVDATRDHCHMKFSMIYAPQIAWIPVGSWCHLQLPGSTNISIGQLKKAFIKDGTCRVRFDVFNQKLEKGTRILHKMNFIVEVEPSMIRQPAIVAAYQGYANNVPMKCKTNLKRNSSYEHNLYHLMEDMEPCNTKQL